jgi:hypothetical protein
MFEDLGFGAYALQKTDDRVNERNVMCCNCVRCRNSKKVTKFELPKKWRFFQPTNKQYELGGCFFATLYLIPGSRHNCCLTIKIQSPPQKRINSDPDKIESVMEERHNFFLPLPSMGERLNYSNLCISYTNGLLYDRKVMDKQALLQPSRRHKWSSTDDRDIF